MSIKCKSPFGKGWVYVAVECGSRNGIGFHRQLWRNTKTGKLKWHNL